MITSSDSIDVRTNSRGFVFDDDKGSIEIAFDEKEKVECVFTNDEDVLLSCTSGDTPPDFEVLINREHFRWFVESLRAWYNGLDDWEDSL